MSSSILRSWLRAHPSSCARRGAVLVLLAFFLFGVASSAQTGLTKLIDAARSPLSSEAPRVGLTADGAVRFVGAPPGGYFEVEGSPLGAEEKARSFLDLYVEELFSLSSNE